MLTPKTYILFIVKLRFENLKQIAIIGDAIIIRNVKTSHFYRCLVGLDFTCKFVVVLIGKLVVKSGTFILQPFSLAQIPDIPS